jgi:hypothetical protein
MPPRQSSSRPKSILGSSAEISLDGIGDNVQPEPPGEESGNPFPDPRKLGKVDRFFFYNYVPAIDGMNQLIIGIGVMLLVRLSSPSLCFFGCLHSSLDRFFRDGSLS